MAKLFGEIAAKSLLTLDKSFARANGQPLDASEVYYSLEAAKAYAAGAQAYIGQKIVVIEDGVVTHYSVDDAAGNLKELGAKPVADGTTISIAEDGKITLANLADKAEGTYNAVLVNGVLTWVKPSETTVEGLSDLISALTGRVDAIAEDYLKAADKKELSDAVAAEKARAEAAEQDLQNQINVILDNPDAEEAINSINEFAKYVEEHGEIAEGFRTSIKANADAIDALELADAGIIERIGELEKHDHSSYATNEALGEVSVVASNAASKANNLEGRINEIVATGGEPNTINTIKVNDVILDIAEDKSVNIVVPTKASDLVDDTGFDARITAAQNKADEGVSAAAGALTAANKAQDEVDALETVVGGIQTTIAGHGESIADHLSRIAVLENADSQHAAEYSALNEIVQGHTTTIASLATQGALAEVAAKAGANEAAIKVINDTTIPAIREALGNKVETSTLNSYNTKEEISNIVIGLEKAISDAQTAATYDDSAIRQLIADEAARADAAEKANAKDIGDINALLATVFENDDDTALNSFKELASWIDEHGDKAAEMVEGIAANTAAIAAINNADSGILAKANKYTDDAITALPAATAEALGLVKFDNATIKMNDSQQLYVAKVSTDVLEQGEQPLVLNGGSASSN